MHLLSHRFPILLHPGEEKPRYLLKSFLQLWFIRMGHLYLIYQPMTTDQNARPEVIQWDVHVDGPALVALGPIDMKGSILKVEVPSTQVSDCLASDPVACHEEHHEVPDDLVGTALGLENDPPALLEDGLDLLGTRGVGLDVLVP